MHHIGINLTFPVLRNCIDVGRHVNRGSDKCTFLYLLPKRKRFLRLAQTEYRSNTTAQVRQQILFVKNMRMTIYQSWYQVFTLRRDQQHPFLLFDAGSSMFSKGNNLPIAHQYIPVRQHVAGFHVNYVYPTKQSYGLCRVFGTFSFSLTQTKGVQAGKADGKKQSHECC